MNSLRPWLAQGTSGCRFCLKLSARLNSSENGAMRMQAEAAIAANAASPAGFPIARRDTAKHDADRAVAAAPVNQTYFEDLTQC
ncbi:hypothetical protein [Rhizobium sullae]|uniref:hypothetical protein n=1 Tax=Rhizobium sullae TaxID=50338 RepID=UPI001051E980|nr:hypothetical protein [Rhizobium sullae]